MERTKDEKIKNLHFIIILCILCAATLGIVGIYHLIAFNRPWDYYSAAGSIGLLCALVGVYKKVEN